MWETAKCYLNVIRTLRLREVTHLKVKAIKWQNQGSNWKTLKSVCVCVCVGERERRETRERKKEEGEGTRNESERKERSPSNNF